MTANDAPTPAPLTRSLAAMAVGRIALGGASLAVPSALARVFRINASPELDYMTRIYGARAIALGVGYLSAGRDRRRWQRLGLLVDGSDTISGLAHLVRRDLPRGSALAMATLTGTYAALGAAHVSRDRAR
ncbi:hypothetical protein [Patulibacter defluvii]|uniref:hypothetical protein n=1 Tax=Patulibacter defluvii TaxID=3095358 RepID=UPI002A74C70C|nr:hypothetical protein [Patulibacter sp. DM4]